MIYSKVIVVILCAWVLCSCKQEKSPLEQGAYIETIQKGTIYDSLDQAFNLLKSDETRIIYLIRHAEKDTFPKSNPVLNEIGVKRSEKLSDILRGTRVDQIYSTIFTRTLFTVDSLSRDKGMTIKPYDPRDLEGFSSKLLTDVDDKTVLVVGHSNTTPRLINLLLGEEKLADFDESEYDHFHIVRIDGENKELISFKYKP